jgi:hypothetical protein
MGHKEDSGKPRYKESWKIVLGLKISDSKISYFAKL